jgi:hypothetical protein
MPFEYVNGGLFADTGSTRRSSTRGPYRYAIRTRCQRENWQGDQPGHLRVHDPVGRGRRSKRSELGMHYTSVPNIMKVLGPLFLDDLDAADREGLGTAASAPCAQVLDRIAKIRVFDPACGSGNFLVVAYRALRAREIRVLTRLAAAGWRGLGADVVWRADLANFYGIEITPISRRRPPSSPCSSRSIRPMRGSGEAFGRTARGRCPCGTRGNIIL